MLPNLVTFVHSHTLLSQVVSVFMYLWSITVAVCLATTKVSDEQLSKLPARLAALVRASRHFGTNTLPFLQEMYIVFMGAAKAAAVILVMGLVIGTGAVTESCSAVKTVTASGSVGASPTGSWSVSVGAVISFAQSLDASALRLSTGLVLTTQQRADLDAALQDTAASLPVLQDAVNAISAVMNATNACRLLAAIDSVIASRLHVLTLLQDLGVTLPADLPVTIEAIAAVGDAVAPAISPGCDPDANAGNARTISRFETVRHALATRSHL